MAESRRTLREPVASPRQTLAEPARRTLAERVSKTLESSSQQPAEPCGELPSGAVVFRPHRRPPIARLTMLDDGSHEVGETWRLREECHVVGRGDDADTRIPHDPDVSGRHAEIIRRWEDGGYRWYLVDLKSTNGTYLRVARAALRNRRELLLGGKRYEFLAPETVAPGVERAMPARTAENATTQTFRAVGTEPAVPRLVELDSEGNGTVYQLPGESVRIGRAADCEITIDDPFLEASDARIFRDERGRWTIAADETLNGVWVRVQRVPLESCAWFQVGEQRFRFELL